MNSRGWLSGFLAFLGLTLASQGQGTIWMANRVEGRLDEPLEVTASPPGEPVTGTWLSQLLYALPGQQLRWIGTPTPVVFENPTTNRVRGSGYFSGGVVELPDVPPGTEVQVQVVTWSPRLGSFIDGLVNSMGDIGASKVFTVTAGGGGRPAAILSGLQGYFVTSVLVAPPLPLDTASLPGAVNVTKVGRFTHLHFPHEMTIQGALRGPLAVLAQGAAGMDVLDVSVPAFPRRLSWWRGTNASSQVALLPGLAVSVNSAGFLTTVDLSIPERPRALGTTRSGFKPATAIEGMLADEGVACVSRTSGGVEIFDLSQPSSPASVALVFLQRSPVMDLRGRTLIVGKVSEVMVYDLTQPAQPRVAGRWFLPPPAAVRTLALTDRLACVLTTGGELQVWDRSSPDGRLLGALTVGKDATQLAASGRFLVVGSPTGPHSQLLRLIDLSQPQQPVEVGGHTRSYAGGFVWDGDLLMSVEASSVQFLQAAGRLGLTRNPAGSLQLQLSGQPQQAYRLETADNLGGSTDWSTAGEIILTNQSQVIDRPAPAESARKFYRAIPRSN